MREALRIGAILEAVVLVRQDRRDVVRLVANIFGLDRRTISIILISRRCCRVFDRSIAVDALDCDFDWSRRRAIDRREMRVAVDNVFLRDRVRRDRCRAFEVRDVVVRQAVGTFAREVVVADFLRPLTVRAVKRCIVRIVHATECRIQSLLRIAILDAGYIVVPILRFVELRAIDRRRIANLNGQVSLLNMQVCRVRLDVVVLQLVDTRRDVIVTNVVRLRIAEVAVRRIRQVHDRRIIAVLQALDIRRERLVDRAVRRRLVVRIDGQISFVDFKVTLRVDDFVVDACAILEADIFHIDGIRIRIFVGISSRATGLIHVIDAAGLNGQDSRSVIQLIAIDNRLARHAFLVAGERCGERPVFDGRIAIGLVAAAVDVDLASEDFDGAAILCSGIFIAACFTFVRQVIAFRSSFDVVNRLVIGFIGRCFIAARTRCGLCPAFARERAAAIVVVGYVAFVEGIRIFVDVMFVLILSNERCFSCGRDIVIRQFFAVDFRHVVSGDIDGRLYLEDVLVAVVLTCRVRSARRAPLCVRAAVEVRAELIGIWRVGIDLPVAARTGLDGRDVCRGQVLERTACTLHIDDNSIVVLRIGVQRTVIMLFVQYDRAIRRGQVDVFMRRDAIDMDVARSLDVDAFSIRCNAVADCDVLARDTDTFVRVNNARVVAAAADCDIASVDLDVLQSNRVADVTGNINVRIASIDDESRMRQILFLDKATNRSSSL